MVGKEEDWAYFEISLFLDKFNYTLYYLGKFMLYFADSNLLQAWLFGLHVFMVYFSILVQVFLFGYGLNMQKQKLALAVLFNIGIFR